MPPLARAAAHPRLTTLFVSPSSTLRPCRHHNSRTTGTHQHAFSSCKRPCLSHKYPSPPSSSTPCGKAASFHSTCHLRASATADEMKQKNHYDRLRVPTNATPAEIKKSFYALSKAHHPDANRNDPDAAHTFSLLSESYTVLSDPPRRAAYDRDTLRLHSRPPDEHSPSARAGSYHSAAGGRAPSGLSRRRGTFRGPPPSFYRSGGWGTQSEKRRAAHESSTGSGGGASDTAGGSNYDAWWSAQQAGGMGPGGNPFGHRDDVPHFDRKQHTKTHQYQDERRSQRSQKQNSRESSAEREAYETGLAGHFLMVSGVLGAALLAPMLYFQLANLGKPRREK